ncbi:hypothetical protein [Isoptericola nanjingensis]|uniref:hypothetical protein n=1 Tax=Isoptericola nanjingensis TaxID=903413 RepID=UPI003D20B473
MSVDSNERRRQADKIAAYDHASTSARPAHRIIARHLWHALRDLGFDQGRVLAVGEDAATLLGLPHTDGFSFASLAADVTAEHRPGDRLQTARYRPHADDRFDVVIGLLPYNDVRLQDPADVVLRRATQGRLAVTLEGLTRPGGLTAMLASHDLMDNLYPGVRGLIHDRGDLLGAVRLPAGAHRQLPGLDLPTDLILLRRRTFNEPARGEAFTDSVTVTVEGRTASINTYYDSHPVHMLGTVATDPLAWGPTSITVTNSPDQLGDDLDRMLSKIISSALRIGLTVTPTPLRGTETQRPRAPERSPVSRAPRAHAPSRGDADAGRRIHRHPGLER